MFKYKSHLLILLLLVIITPVCNAQTKAGSEILRDTFDFVPRTHVFFSDDFSRYQTNVLPKELYKTGKGVTVQKTEDYAWLDCYAPSWVSGVIPVLKNPADLRDSFTIECDFAFGNKSPRSVHDFHLFISGERNTSESSLRVWNDGKYMFSHKCDERQGIRRKPISISNVRIPTLYEKRKWHHFAYSYRLGTVKIYVNGHRLISYSGCPIMPTVFGFQIWYPLKIRNLIMATGPLERPFSDIITQDKLVTHAINFEVNKAAIALSGKRYLKDMALFLSEHTEIKLEISGHTDNDGTPESNKTLSQARADAVRKQLILLGINESRLTAKGYGESRPLKPNSSPEGKQENRRVEFKKL